MSKKITVQVQKNITEEIELPQLPYFGKRYSTYYMINDKEVIMYLADCHISIWEPGNKYYDSTLAEVVQQTEPCAEEVFMTVYDLAIQRFVQFAKTAAKDSVTHTMNNIDPKDQEQATEQAADETAAEGQGALVD